MSKLIWWMIIMLKCLIYELNFGNVNAFFFIMQCLVNLLVGSGTNATSAVNNHSRVERVFAIPWHGKVSCELQAQWWLTGCWGYNFWQGHNICFSHAEFGSCMADWGSLFVSFTHSIHLKHVVFSSLCFYCTQICYVLFLPTFLFFNPLIPRRNLQSLLLTDMKGKKDFWFSWGNPHLIEKKNKLENKCENIELKSYSQAAKIQPPCSRYFPTLVNSSLLLLGVEMSLLF